MVAMSSRVIFSSSRKPRRDHAADSSTEHDSLDRRAWLRVAVAGVATGMARVAEAQEAKSEPRSARGKPTRFQIACMTLPYARFPLQRALTGIQGAGYRYVAWGTTHRGGREEGAGPRRRRADRAGQGAGQAVPRPGPGAADDVLRHLPRGAGRPGGPHGPRSSRPRRRACRRCSPSATPRAATASSGSSGSSSSGPIARDHGVTLVVKQHGGETGTGAACAEIVREVDDDGVKVNYDAGNVMDYLDVDPIPDLRACADEVRSFCIKDHRNFPEGRGLRPRVRRDRPLQAAAPGRLHRAGRCRSAARTSSPRSSRRPTVPRASTRWPAGPGSSSKS